MLGLEELKEIVELYRISDKGVKSKKDLTLLDVDLIVNDERYRQMLKMIELLYMPCPRRTGTSSYKIKHTLESLLGEYVSNGWAILGFFHLEFVVAIDKGPNASIKARQHDLNNPVVMKLVKQVMNKEEINIKIAISHIKHSFLPLSTSHGAIKELD